MRSLHFILLLVLAVGLAVSGCELISTSSTPTAVQVAWTGNQETQIDFCGDPIIVSLIAGQHINVGTVTVGNDEENLYVIYNTTGGWVMTETHVAVGHTLDEIPQTPNGNPIPGQFPYQAEHDPPVAQYTYTIDLDSAGFQICQTLYVAAHAAVLLLDSSGDTLQEETAWGEGDDFPGSNWAMYFRYHVQPCNGVPPEGEFRTQTQGGWGTECHGENPGCYRDANFEDCFPNGLTVGCTDGYTALFTSSEAIENFLPQGKAPRSFRKNHTNPTKTEAGVLAGQVVALTLNVEFDLYDPDFGKSEENLQNLIVDDSESPFYGWTVQEVLDEANKVLGGCESDFSPSELNECASKINENYVDGEIDLGFLRLP